MSLNLDKSRWTRVRFGDVVRNVNDTVRDPEGAGVDRVIAMEHMDPGNLSISRWGTLEDGTSFSRRVKPGQTLFGKRRAYQRKIAFAEFDAICSGDILTFEVDKLELLAEFLPFLVQSDAFFNHALGTSAGSLSPRTSWRDLAKFEFDLPPLDEQKRIAELLWAIVRHEQAVRQCIEWANASRAAWLHTLFKGGKNTNGFLELDDLVDTSRPICYGVLKPGPEFDGGRLIVDVKDYPSGRIQLEQVRRCDPDIEAAFQRSRLRTGDVLLSIRGTIGRVAIVPEPLAGHNISRDSARISGDPEKISPEFLRLVLESPDVQQEIRRTTTGLAVKGINVARIRKLKVPDWTLDQQRVAVKENARIEDAVNSLEAASDASQNMRVSMLAKIFGGR